MMDDFLKLDDKHSKKTTDGVLGTVIMYANTPDIHSFHFVMSAGYGSMQDVTVGKYVGVQELPGIIIGYITNIFKVNEYYLNANSMKESKSITSPLKSIFPVDQWEYQIAEVEVLGCFPSSSASANISASGMQDDASSNVDSSGNFTRARFPASPGNLVRDIDPAMLEKFLGFDFQHGLEVGALVTERLPVKINLGRMMQKHFAILAMSGAGKSYLASIILEELMKRGKNEGRPAVIIVDTHGEYSRLLCPTGTRRKLKHANIEIIDASFFQIGTPFIQLSSFFNYMPNLSPVQGRELFRIFTELKKTKKLFDLKDIMNMIREDEALGKKTKDALDGWLYLLDRLGIFFNTEFPRVNEIITPGRINVLNLAGITSMKHKQIIVDYLASRAFYLRKHNSVAPFCLFLEEAHQFVPQAAKSKAIAKQTIETIAREGRKFLASLCLISQRPVHLNTTVLSQCNSQFILRVSNPYDLDHIRSSSEKITKNALKMISSLPVGHALAVGAMVNIPVFFNVRNREFLKNSNKELFVDVLKAWESKE